MKPVLPVSYNCIFNVMIFIEIKENLRILIDRVFLTNLVTYKGDLELKENKIKTSIKSAEKHKD